MICVPFSGLERITEVRGKNASTHSLGPSISGLPSFSGCVLLVLAGKQGDPLWSVLGGGPVPVTGLHGSPGMDLAPEVSALMEQSLESTITSP